MLEVRGTQGAQARTRCELDGVSVSAIYARRAVSQSALGVWG